MLAPILSPCVPSEAAPTIPPAATASPFDTLDDPADGEEWTQEDLVFVHWRMLQQVEGLCDPKCPLDEKLDTLRWIFTEPDKDELPFSFATCVRIVACSPLSPIPYCGQVDVEEMRDRIRANLKRWLDQSLDRYPEWVRQALLSRPDWVIPQLSRHPQWINEQLKRIKDEGDLFA